MEALGTADQWRGGATEIELPTEQITSKSHLAC